MYVFLFCTLLLVVVVMVPLYTMFVARQLPFIGQFVGFWQLHVFVGVVVGVVVLFWVEEVELWLVLMLLVVVSVVVVVSWVLSSFLLCAEMIPCMLLVQL